MSWEGVGFIDREELKKAERNGEQAGRFKVSFFLKHRQGDTIEKITHHITPGYFLSGNFIVLPA
jgi:hypothetical protein